MYDRSLYLEELLSLFGYISPLGNKIANPALVDRQAQELQLAMGRLVGDGQNGAEHSWGSHDESEDIHIS